MKRIAISSTWAAFERQDERSELISADTWAYFAALYQHYYPDVLAFLRFLVGTPEVAEDLTSLVFEKALAHLADMRAPDSAGSWLFRIARNSAMDYSAAASL